MIIAHTWDRSCLGVAHFFRGQDLRRGQLAEEGLGKTGTGPPLLNSQGGEARVQRKFNGTLVGRSRR
jgi:hypothetical protein